MATWRLYIDEIGEHRLLPPEDPRWSDPGRRYFSLTGVWYRQDELIERIRPEMDALKRNHLPYDPDDPPVLHRNAIGRRRGAFHVLKDRVRAEAFHRDLLALLSRWDFSFGTIIVDKKTHAVGPSSEHPPYHYSLRLLIERYRGACVAEGGRGDVLAEARDKRLDRLLRLEYAAIHAAGTRYQSRENLQAFLTSKEIKIKPKTANVEGLQIADLIAYPAHLALLAKEKRIPQVTGKFGNVILAAVRRKWNYAAQRLV